jgi:hypothetical protein
MKNWLRGLGEEFKSFIRSLRHFPVKHPRWTMLIKANLMGWGFLFTLYIAPGLRKFDGDSTKVTWMWGEPTKNKVHDVLFYVFIVVAPLVAFMWTKLKNMFFDTQHVVQRVLKQISNKFLSKYNSGAVDKRVRVTLFVENTETSPTYLKMLARWNGAKSNVTWKICEGDPTKCTGLAGMAWHDEAGKVFTKDNSLPSADEIRQLIADDSHDLQNYLDITYNKKEELARRAEDAGYIPSSIKTVVIQLNNNNRAVLVFDSSLKNVDFPTDTDLETYTQTIGLLLKVTT